MPLVRSPRFVMKLLSWTTSAALCVALQLAAPSVANVLTRAKAPPLPDLYEASIEELQAGLNAKTFTSVNLVTVRASVSWSTAQA